MTTEDCVAALETLLARPPLGEPGDALPVVLSGVTFDNVGLARAIESTGLFIVGDDLATGSRWWTVHVDEEAPDPWLALARAYLTKPPCSVKEPSAPRADHLLAQVSASAAAGVLFYLTRYCDSEEAEWPYLRDRLVEAGVPSMVIEGEHRDSGFAQLRTRLEAFREQLEEGMGEWA
jgi:benzoyl-CoA reductase/2-hydroxyglutaryl-CoA dehydratase subunit BcrC/BadD/HgdB